MASRCLPATFFRGRAARVAQDLLGKFLVRKKGKVTQALMITEVEIYDGPKDKASHASRGKTERTKVMFGPGGVWYVYFVYGMHHLLNIVVGEKDYPAAILIRGVEGVSGPARVAKTFGVDKKFYGLPANKKTGLYIEDRGVSIANRSIKKSARIGVDYAGPIWSKKKLRFFITQSAKLKLKTSN